MDAARVEFLVRPDAWAAWVALYPPAVPSAEKPEPMPGENLLIAAFAEYGDSRLVAAYVLEIVCGDAQRTAADAPLATKRIKLGPIEIEKATTTIAASAAKASGWCERAQALREEVKAELHTQRRAHSTSVSLEVTF